MCVYKLRILTFNKIACITVKRKLNEKVKKAFWSLNAI